MPADLDDLDALVRRVDPDRWLSSRFITDTEARADVVALYAFDHELARARHVASNPLIAEIRLTWWREVLDEIHDGKPARAHPAARALAEAVRRRGLAREPLEAMIDGRIAGLGASGPEIASAARLAGGSVAVCAAAILGDAALAEAARPAGELWAEIRSVGDLGQAEIGPRLSLARRAARRLQPPAFAAVAHVALARSYAAGGTPSPAWARVRLVAAVLTGSL